MPPNPEPTSTSVLLIDGFTAERTHFADQLKCCSPEYQVIEATDGQSGRAISRSQRGDCVVLELVLPDQSGFKLLVDLVPYPSRPQVAVIVLTRLTYRGIWELAKQYGAYVCIAKQHTTGEDLDKAIQRAVAFVGQLPKEDRYRPFYSGQK